MKRRSRRNSKLSVSNVVEKNKNKKMKEKKKKKKKKRKEFELSSSSEDEDEKMRQQQEKGRRKSQNKLKFNKKRNTFLIRNKTGIDLDELLESDLARTLAANDSDSDSDVRQKSNEKRNKVKYPKIKGFDEPSKRAKNLFRWCRKGKRDKVESAVSGTLVSKGINIDSTDEFGHCPIIIAASHGHYKLVRTLLTLGADANSKDCVGGTPLHHASVNGSVNCIQLLINHGGDPTTIDSKLCTPLHYACECGHWEVAATLLQLSRMTINWQDSLGLTALMKAMKLPAEDNTLDIIDLLAENGADFDIRNKAGSDAMYLAKKNTVLYPFVLQILKERLPTHPLALHSIKEEERKLEATIKAKQQEKDERNRVKYEGKLLELAAQAAGAVIATPQDVVQEEYVPLLEVVDLDAKQENNEESESSESESSSSESSIMDLEPKKVIAKPVVIEKKEEPEENFLSSFFGQIASLSVSNQPTATKPKGLQIKQIKKMETDHNLNTTSTTTNSNNDEGSTNFQTQ